MRALSEWMELRRARKAAREALRSARHVLNMREDVIPADLAASIRHGMEEVSSATRKRSAQAIHGAMESLGSLLARAAPPRSAPRTREYVEVIAVAVTVALGFRTYFLQPFKIPTGSMQPTLYGVHSGQELERSFIRVSLDAVRGVIAPVGDRFLMLPFLGARYMVVHAKESGVVGLPQLSATDPTVLLLPVGSTLHAMPRDARPFAMPGESVAVGSVLWQGWKCAGDHVLVNRMALNFGIPRRDQVMVFSTEGISGLPPGTHYIKRLVGCPNETISIAPPRLLVNGEEPKGCPGIERAARNQGYRLTRPEEQGILGSSEATLVLGDREYAGFGDNTANSRDSRYWGSVPQRNLVGPAVFVYWPFTDRWGLIR
jgi:signal peptidase I